MSNSNATTVKDASRAAVSALQGPATTMGVHSCATFAQQKLPATPAGLRAGVGSVTAGLNAAIPEARGLKDAGTRIISVGVKGADANRLS